jgi:hypothetical protein
VTAIVVDTFHRNNASGWTPSDTGDAYSSFGAGGTILGTDTSVASPLGHQSVPTTVAYRVNFISAFNHADVDITLTGSVAFAGGAITGGQLEFDGVLWRGLSTGSYYHARVDVLAGGQLKLEMTSSDFVTSMGQVTGVVGGLTYTTGKVLSIRVQALGSWHRAKIWDPAGAEPLVWDITAYDNATTGPGWVGIRTGVGTGNTNTKPIVSSYSAYSVSLMPAFDPNTNPVSVWWAPGADLSQPYTAWPWVDITTKAQYTPGISATLGGASESIGVTTGNASLTCDNTGGFFSRKLATGTNYPNVKKRTPVWLQIGPAPVFAGYLSGAPPVWSAAGKAPMVKLALTGALEPFTVTQQPAGQSTLRRSVQALTTSVTTPVTAYWPLENGNLQSVTGDLAANLFDATWATPTGFAGSDQLPTFAADTVFAANVSNFPGSSTNWQVDWYMNLATPASTVTVMRIFAGGTINNWTVQFSATSITITGYAADNSTPVVGAFGLSIFPFNAWWHLRLAVKVVAGTITYRLVVIPLGFVSTGFFVTNTLSGTLGPPRLLSIQAQAALAGFGLGHVSVLTGFDIDTVDAAGLGYDRESASDRWTRICAEERIALFARGTSSTLMGPQPIASPFNVLLECVTADKGFMYDGEQFGISIVSRNAIYNQPAKMTLTNQSFAPSFEPADDAQLIANDWTVTQSVGGASAEYAVTDGPMGTDEIGSYAQQQTVNLHTPSDLLMHAAWLAYQGAVDNYYYSTITFEMFRAAMSSQFDAWTGLRIMDRIVISGIQNTFAEMAPDDIELVVRGHSQQIKPTWSANLNTLPGIQYLVGIWNTTRYDSADTTLSIGYNTTATSFVCNVASGTPWIQGAVNFDLFIAGERVTCTNITGTTFTVTRSVNGVVKTQTAGEHVRLWNSPKYAL